MNQIYFGDNLTILQNMPAESIDLIYIDPPFNTGKRQIRNEIKIRRSQDGGRVGFQDLKYETETIGTKAYDDIFDDYLAFLQPRLQEAYRILSPTGSFYFHIDYREVHYCKILLDQIFGRDGFLNEIIWAYDYGGRSKKKWPAKHDNILVYVKNPQAYTFNTEDIDRIPYMAPGLVGPEKAKRGKLPTPQLEKKKLGIQPKSPWGYLIGSSGPHPIRVMWCSIFLREAERRAPVA